MEPVFFGPFLRDERLRHNLTQKDLAQKLNVSIAAVSKWERGRCLPDLSKLDDIAQVLDLTMLEVLECRRQPENALPRQELATVFEETLHTATAQHQKRLRKWLGLGLLVGTLAVLLYFFPLYHVAQVWLPSYYQTGEISMLAYIGSPGDRRTAKPIMALAEQAFSDLSVSSAEEAKAKYGPLSRYCTGPYPEVVTEQHDLRLWSARFYASEGWMWVYYSQKGLDRRGNTVTGSWDIPALWYLQKDEIGRWAVTHIKEHP